MKYLPILLAQIRDFIREKARRRRRRSSRAALKASRSVEGVRIWPVRVILTNTPSISFSHAMSSSSKKERLRIGDRLVSLSRSTGRSPLRVDFAQPSPRVAITGDLPILHILQASRYLTRLSRTFPSCIKLSQLIDRMWQTADHFFRS